MGLTPKQIAFCDYYIEYGDATKAALAAGYSEKTAYSIGSENLRKPELSAYIKKRLDEEREKRVASADEVMEFFSAVMRGEVRDAFDLDPSLDTRLNAGKELMKRYNAAEGRNQSSLEKLDALLKEFNDAVKEDKENE
jgi:phage terminase small subunit